MDFTKQAMMRGSRRAMVRAGAAGVCVLGLLVTVVLCAADPGAVRLAVANSYWERAYDQAGEKPVQASYPTEPAVPWLTAYAVTRGEKYAAQAERQLAYAHGLERGGLIVVRRPDFPAAHRDAQARQIYNFYLAYRILAEGKYLRWADSCAQAMLATIPRAAHECAGQTHTQFAASFVNLDDPASKTPVYAVDVNQNAEVGLAFGLLYHDPASRFFGDPVAEEIAREETLASMSIQNMATGAIPLTESGERRTQYDTAYGSYAAFCWVWSQLLWQEEQFEPHVQAAGRWLAGHMDLATGSDRYFSFRNPRTSIPSWGAAYRLPLYWYCGLDASGFVAGLFARLPEEDPGDFAVTTWAYYDLMGIPQDYYVEGKGEGRAAAR